MGVFMKRYLFLCLVISLIILVLLYFYDKRDVVINNIYSNMNIYIEYPLFNNKNIDNYISDYVNDIISSCSYEYDYFIDYDYNILDGYVYLNMYKYKYYDNIYNMDVDSFIVDINNKSISGSNIKSDYYYDLYYQKYVNKNDKMVAITFDGGPGINTNRVLDILNKYNVRATFFIEKDNSLNNNDIIKRISDRGMEIGIYFDDNNLNFNSIKGNLSSFSLDIFDISGKYPNLVRCNNDISRIINRSIIKWSLDSRDKRYHSSNIIRDNIINNVFDGDIILMHDIYSASANSLEMVISRLISMGYKIVSVSDLFKYKGIDINNIKVYSNCY